jgi:hypothetical protein
VVGGLKGLFGVRDAVDRSDLEMGPLPLLRIIPPLPPRHDSEPRTLARNQVEQLSEYALLPLRAPTVTWH